MTNVVKNVPELRFPEFSDCWQGKQLGEVASVTKLAGFEFTKHVKYSDFGEIPAIRGLNVKNGGFVFDDVKYIDDSDFSKLSRSKLESENIVYTYVGTIGEAAIVPANKLWYLAPNVAKIVTKSIEPKFLLQILLDSNFKRKEVLSWISTSSQPALSMTNIRKFKMQIPKSSVEQKKIGEFFSKLDRQIELEEQKLEKLEEQKKGYMQKIFSQQLRFKDKNGNDYPEWEEKKLGEVSNIIGGGTPSTKIPDYWDGEINWYSPVEIDGKTYISESRKKITELGLKKSSAKILPIGTVLFTSRAGIGKTAILEAEGCTNQGFQSIVPKKGALETYFIFSMTHKVKRYAEIVGAGSTFTEVSGKQLSTMPLFLPLFEEQQKIGGFFYKVDKMIENQSKKIDLLKERKKGFLQKMFV